jgi:hypothetical protein
MTKKEFLVSVVSFLSKLKYETDANLENPINNRSRVILSAIANSAKVFGMDSISTQISDALSTSDPQTQEIILFSGLEKGPLSDKSIKSVYNIASNTLQSAGVDVDQLAAKAVDTLQPEEAPEGSDDLGDELALDDPTEGDIEDSEADDVDLSAMFGDEEGGDTPEEESSDEKPDEESGEDSDVLDSGEDLEDTSPEKPDEEEAEGRIAKEQDEEEVDLGPQPMYDWYIRFDINQ